MELHSCAGLQMPLGRAVLTAHWLGVADAIGQSRLTRLHVHVGMNRGSVDPMVYRLFGAFGTGWDSRWGAALANARRQR